MSAAEAETSEAETEAEPTAEAEDPEGQDTSAPRPRRRRRKRSVKSAGGSTEPAAEPNGNQNTAPPVTSSDVDGNVAEGLKPKVVAPTPNKKPPKRAGRGYSNRVVY